VLYDAVSLGNMYSTCRYNQVFSYSRADTIKNNSFYKVVFASLFQKSITNFLVTRRHIKSLRILYAVDKLCIRNENMEMDINYTILIFRLNVLLQHGTKRDFWKSS